MREEATPAASSARAAPAPTSAPAPASRLQGSVASAGGWKKGRQGRRGRRWNGAACVGVDPGRAVATRLRHLAQAVHISNYGRYPECKQGHQQLWLIAAVDSEPRCSRRRAAGGGVPPPCAVPSQPQAALTPPSGRAETSCPLGGGPALHAGAGVWFRGGHCLLLPVAVGPQATVTSSPAAGPSRWS